MTTSPTPLRARVAGALLLLALAAPGCHRYQALAPADLAPGRQVRAELGDEGAADLARWIGPRGVAVGGRIESVSDTMLTLSVTEVVRRNGVAESWRGEQVSMPRAQLASVRERRFDRTRTLLLGAGVVAALVSVDAALGDAGLLFRGRGGTGSGARK